MKQLMSRDELNAEIETVDGELATNNAPLLGRPFETYRRLVKRFGIAGHPFAPFGIELFQEILDWYSQRYGQQMNPDLKLGEKPVWIRGVAYFFKFPVGYGTVRGNVFAQIQGITPDLLKALTQSEQDAIAVAFEDGYKQVAVIETMALCALRVNPDVCEIVSQGRKDLSHGVVILKDGAELQGAVFHAHQAAEKFMKGALAQSTDDTVDNARKQFGKYGHDLAEGLKALRAADNRFSAVEPEVNALQAYVPVMTTIRYKEQDITATDAARATNAAFVVCAFVGDKLFS